MVAQHRIFTSEQKEKKSLICQLWGLCFLLYVFFFYLDDSGHRRFPMEIFCVEHYRLQLIICRFVLHTTAGNQVLHTLMHMNGSKYQRTWYNSCKMEKERNEIIDFITHECSRFLSVHTCESPNLCFQSQINAENKQYKPPMNGKWLRKKKNIMYTVECE